MFNHPSFRTTIFALGRLAGNRVTIPGAILLLVGLAGGDLVSPVALGRLSMGNAINTFVANLGAILDNGLVRAAFVILGLIFIGRGASSVAKQDQARADAADRRAEERIAERDSALAAVNARIDELMDRAARLPKLLAARGLLEDELREAHAVVQRAKDAIESYSILITRANHMELGRSPVAVTRTLDGSLRGALDTVGEAARIVRVPDALKEQMLRPELLTDRDEHGDPTFTIDSNYQFFEDHRINVGALFCAYDILERARIERTRELARVQEQLDEVLQESGQ